MKRTILAAAIAGMGTIAVAQTAPNEITFGEYGQIETSLSGLVGDPAAGLEIMVNRGKGNCIACHQVTALEEYPFHGEVGPSLDFVGERWEEADLRGIVANAKMTFPESVMPSFYKTEGFVRAGDGYTGRAAESEIEPILTAQEIEDVVAYLMTLKE
ncbi:monoheme cytochrome SoxX (sulfur oxidation) [Octadecabacter temperatus]|uniref:Cytochrome c n=1 Tax=Octadecabacter temperatus TaxID=1458307 RepID=A0A0K0Y4V9_9RHOB|nr:sulfur oxidation c-type cytochrome SoxX [Octadecabacter temperatus]AKS45872.1 Cytochrome c [Octadecabacter temperatus]SIO02438.1 monoheme cytochrome SoxX (sulfur oxidation) [Octadecabacter temperatus]